MDLSSPAAALAQTVSLKTAWLVHLVSELFALTLAYWPAYENKASLNGMYWDLITYLALGRWSECQYQTGLSRMWQDLVKLLSDPMALTMIVAGFVLIEAAFLLISVVLLPWAAHDEPLARTWRHTLRVTWLGTECACLFVGIGWLITSLRSGRRADEVVALLLFEILAAGFCLSSSGRVESNDGYHVSIGRRYARTAATTSRTYLPIIVARSAGHRSPSHSLRADAIHCVGTGEPDERPDSLDPALSMRCSALNGSFER